jgi:hypothetical protein
MYRRLFLGVIFALGIIPVSFSAYAQNNAEFDFDIQYGDFLFGTLVSQSPDDNPSAYYAFEGSAGDVISFGALDPSGELDGIRMFTALIENDTNIAVEGERLFGQPGSEDMAAEDIAALLLSEALVDHYGVRDYTLPSSGTYLIGVQTVVTDWFTAGVSQNTQRYAVYLNGTTTTVSVPDAIEAYHLAFAGADSPQDFHADLVMRHAGTERRLSDNETGFIVYDCPSFSSDSSQILFSRRIAQVPVFTTYNGNVGARGHFGHDQRTNAELYITAANSTSPVNTQLFLDSGRFSDEGGVFSPDGRTVVFTSIRHIETVTNDTVFADELYSVDIASGTITQLTDSPNIDDKDPVFTPDGQFIVWTSGDDLYRMNADGTGAGLFVSGARSAAFTLDGTQIAYIRGNALVVANADGSGARTLTNDPNNVTNDDPAWSPDGAWLAFKSDQRNPGFYFALQVIRVDGTERTQITTNAREHACPAFAPITSGSLPTTAFLPSIDGAASIASANTDSVPGADSADLPSDLNVSADAIRLRVDQQAAWNEMGASFFLPQGWSISGSDAEYISLQSANGFMNIYPIDVFPGDSYRTTAFAETSNTARSSENETGEVTERTLPELDYTYYRTDFSDTDDDFDGVLIVFDYQGDYYAILATQSPLTGERTALGAAAEAVMASLLTGQPVTAIHPPFGQGIIGQGLDEEAAAIAAEMGMLGEIITDVPETLIMFDQPPTLAEPNAAVVQPAPSAASLTPTIILDGLASDVPVTYDDVVQGQLQSLSGQRSRRDSFRLFALAGDQVTITVISDEFDPALEFFTTNSTQLAANDDFEGQNARITIEIPSDNEYEIVVTSREQGQNGEYLLIVEAVAADVSESEPAQANESPTGGGEIAYGDSLEGFLPSGGDVRYSFAGNSGDRVTIAMYADFDTYLELLDANGRLIAENDDYNGLNSQIDFALPSSSTYTIVARGFDPQASGAFTLVLDGAVASTSGNADIANAISITYGGAAQGRLSRGGDVRYAFSGSAGDQVVITMNAPSFDTYLELYDANGRLIAENDDYDGLNSQIDVTLPGNGTYTIVARGFDTSASGSFILSLEGS